MDGWKGENGVRQNPGILGPGRPYSPHFCKTEVVLRDFSRTEDQYDGRGVDGEVLIHGWLDGWTDGLFRWTDHFRVRPSASLLGLAGAL